MKRNYNSLIRIIIGLVIIAILTYKIDIAKVAEVLSRIKWFIVPLFFFNYLFMILAGTLNVNLILRAVGINIHFKDILKDNFISKSIGSFFLGRLGEGSLAYLLNKRGVSYGNGVLALFIDKFITLLVVCFFSIFVFFIFFKENAVLLTLMVLLAIIILSISLLSEEIRYFIRKYILRKYAILFSGFSKGLFFILKKRKRILFLNLIITVIMLTSISSVIYLLLLFFGIKFSLLYIIIIQSISMLAAQIPITIGGLGIRESVVVYLYYNIGIDPAIIGTIYLMFAMFSYLASGIVLMCNLKKIKVWK